MEEKIKVYIRIDENNNIIEVNSDIFIENLNGWIEIDSGFGDKYAHAQSQYLPKPLVNDYGSYTYRYEDGEIVENSIETAETIQAITQQIAEYKQLLNDTDYQAIKYAEGQLTAEEYEPMKIQRAGWRVAINELEQTLQNLGA